MSLPEIPEGWEWEIEFKPAPRGDNTNRITVTLLRPNLVYGAERMHITDMRTINVHTKIEQAIVMQVEAAAYEIANCRERSAAISDVVKKHWGAK